MKIWINVFVSLLGLLELRTTPSAAAQKTGGGSVIVRGALGGDIFGFDIDPNGNTGLLCEAVGHSDGTVSAAVETFDQTTGKILETVATSETQDDFVTLGVTTDAIGIVEIEHVRGLFHVVRHFRVLNLIEGNMSHGLWSAPLDRHHVINQVKPSAADTSDVAVYALSTSLTEPPVVFSSNVRRNTFGPVIPITDPVFTTEAPPVIAYDSVRNRVILGHDFPSPFILPPRLAFVDLTTGAFAKRTGLGLGVINGIAVDTEDNILCTDTSFDSAVQFYDLNNHTGINVLLPGADPSGSLASGADIAFDPINKLFLVAQEFSDGELSNGSSIQVYDTAGNFVKSIDGLLFQGGFNVFPIHIALNPARRSGFVNGPDLTKSLQWFTY